MKTLNELAEIEIVWLHVIDVLATSSEGTEEGDGDSNGTFGKF